MRVLRLLCSLACLLLLFVQAASANGTITTQAITTARTEIWKDLNTGAIGSAAIAIMDKGKVVYSEGFGMADREKSIPVNKKTIFDIGSVSKIYVATAIMVLVDEGKVALDAPASKYLPDFSMVDERYKDITVRMLLNHSSGLPGTTGENNFGFAFNQDVYKDTLDALASSQLKHRPGERSIYCNDGFTLAEMIVARVSGQSYLEFLQERLAVPGLARELARRIGHADLARHQLRRARHHLHEPQGPLARYGLGVECRFCCGHRNDQRRINRRRQRRRFQMGLRILVTRQPERTHAPLWRLARSCQRQLVNPDQSSGLRWCGVAHVHHAVAVHKLPDSIGQCSLRAA